MNDADKNAYQEKMEAKLTKLMADVRRLEAELKEKRADARLGSSERLAQLRRRGDEVKTKLHALKSASGSAWREARDGVAGAWHDLESSFRKASEEFKK